MARQILYFRTGTSVRIETHVCDGNAGVELELLYNPARDRDAVTVDDVAQAADLIEQRVHAHIEEHGARLGTIVIRHDLEPITFRELGRYGVPLLPEN